MEAIAQTFGISWKVYQSTIPALNYGVCPEVLAYMDYMASNLNKDQILAFDKIQQKGQALAKCKLRLRPPRPRKMTGCTDNVKIKSGSLPKLFASFLLTELVQEPQCEKLEALKMNLRDFIECVNIQWAARVSAAARL